MKHCLREAGPSICFSSRLCLEEAGEKVASVLLAASGSILVAVRKFDVPAVSQVIDLVVRPDGFEPPTTWFEACHTIEIGILAIATT
jgi:hypothetical protein